MIPAVIYESVLFYTNGQVRRWALAVERQFVRHAIDEAPHRSGALEAGIHGSVSRVGPAQLLTIIQSTADHSMYVLMGTSGPIMSNRMWGFRGRTGLEFPRGTFFQSPSTGVKYPHLKTLHGRGYALRLRPGNGYGEKLAVEVSGQRANPFLARAAVATARTNSTLRGWYPDGRDVPSYRAHNRRVGTIGGEILGR